MSFMTLTIAESKSWTAVPKNPRVHYHGYGLEKETPFNNGNFWYPPVNSHGNLKNRLFLIGNTSTQQVHFPASHVSLPEGIYVRFLGCTSIPNIVFGIWRNHIPSGIWPKHPFINMGVSFKTWHVNKVLCTKCIEKQQGRSIIYNTSRNFNSWSENHMKRSISTHLVFSSAIKIAQVVMFPPCWFLGTMINQSLVSCRECRHFWFWEKI